VLQPPPARVHAPGTVSGVYPRLFAPIVSPRKVAGRRALYELLFFYLVGGVKGF
jgi:hypothetical protein